MEKKKNTTILLIIIITLLLVIIFLLFGKNTSSEKGVGQVGISLEEFNKIKLGDSQFTVNDTVCSSGDIAQEEISNTEKNSVYEYKYKYLGETSGYAIITYTADYSKGTSFVLPTVTNKENFNLK